MEKKVQPSSKKDEKFSQTYEGLNDNELLKEILFYQKRQNSKLEKMRADISKLVWWLVAVPFIVVALYMILSNLRVI